ncbi:helix-turn-helix domain-containing protein [Thermosediminibacter litoriperuensis]|uniref:Helix-turn-helix protein n=1 Tax=Thermosediminibacter litoriperuensis TaxID=291989 RepID=A0A5S5B0K0_9FIRM|nr:helix-turn-helix transcriptional regulator [Thermosediminibacter litoriperuensis]TYP58746.1 helix-turn-helix protein [Thermosediminibacter litoriperuensis]
MDLIRIGDKLISLTKITGTLEEMLALRQKGMSQAEVARKFGIDRSFLSRVESLGEVRKGRTIALVGFPLKNTAEIERVAREEGVDFILLMTDRERWDFVYKKSGIELINEIMNWIYRVRQHDVVIILGSDQRIRLFRALLDNEVVAVEIGKSPMKDDAYVEPEYLREIIRKVRED